MAHGGVLLHFTKGSICHAHEIPYQTCYMNMNRCGLRMDLRRRLIPDMTALRSFDSAARHLNFTRAAEELHLTQSSVSRHVQDLEGQLGVALFSRVRRQVVLTPAGAQFHQQTARLLQDCEAMMLRAINTGEGVEVLRIAAPPTFASRWLVPRLPAFTTSHPGVQIDLMTYGAPFLLADQDCDLAFHFGEPFWPRGDCTYLCSERVIPVCAPSIASSGAIGDLLVSQPLLQNAARPLLWQQLMDQAGLTRDPGLRGPRFDNFATIIAAACGGMGLALLPDYLIEDELAQGVLIALDAPGLISNSAYHIVTPEQGVRTPLVERFVTWAADSVRQRQS